MNVAYRGALVVCKRHADRLMWSMDCLRARFPLSESAMRDLDDTELAVLELTKEQGELSAFLDKLYRLEKIGAIASADALVVATGNAQ